MLNKPTAAKHYRKDGSWLLVHGAGGGAWQWRRWQAHLSAWGIRSQAMDLRPGAEGLQATNLDEYLNQLREFVGEGSHSVLVGASMGAVLVWRLSQELASAHKLVMVNPPVTSSRERSNPEIIHWRGNQGLASTRKHMRGASAADCYFAHRCWRNESGKALSQAQNWQPGPPSARTLLVLGSEDASAVDRGDTLAEQLRAERLVIEGAGHLQPLLCEAASRTVHRVRDWAHSSTVRPRPRLSTPGSE